LVEQCRTKDAHRKLAASLAGHVVQLATHGVAARVPTPETPPTSRGRFFYLSELHRPAAFFFKKNNLRRTRFSGLQVIELALGSLKGAAAASLKLELYGREFTVFASDLTRDLALHRQREQVAAAAAHAQLKCSSGGSSDKSSGGKSSSGKSDGDGEDASATGALPPVSARPTLAAMLAVRPERSEAVLTQAKRNRRLNPVREEDPVFNSFLFRGSSSVRARRTVLSRAFMECFSVDVVASALSVLC
jgi:hypothetical protein